MIAEEAQQPSSSIFMPSVSFCCITWVGSKFCTWGWWQSFSVSLLIVKYLDFGVSSLVPALVVLSHLVLIYTEKYQCASRPAVRRSVSGTMSLSTEGSLCFMYTWCLEKINISPSCRFRYELSITGSVFLACFMPLLLLLRAFLQRSKICLLNFIENRIPLELRR